MGRYFYRAKQTGIRRQLRNRMTRAERQFWILVKEKRFRGYRFRRQAGIGVFIVDFYCPSLQLVIELDGGYHEHPEQMQHDQARTDYLMSFGLTVLRFPNQMVLFDTDRVLETLTDYASRYAPTSLSSSPFRRESAR